MKVTVRIHKGHELELRTRKINDDGTVTLRKGSKSQPEWKPTITKVEPKYGHFGRAQFFTDIYLDSNDTWIPDPAVPEADRPKWTKKESKKWIAAHILEKAGEEMKEKGSSIGIWIIAILVVAMGIVQILITTGRLRI